MTEVVEKKRLWLDDVRPAPDESWLWVRTAREAIDALTNSAWEEVSLDHDLGPPAAGTGMDVLDYLERESVDWSDGQVSVEGVRIPKSIKIHTMNTAVWLRMVTLAHSLMAKSK